MSLLAGLKFVKKALPLVPAAAACEAEGSEREGEKRKKHHKKDKQHKDKSRSSSGGRNKDKGINDEPACKRRKSLKPASLSPPQLPATEGGTDWLDQAFSFSGGHGNEDNAGESMTAEEIVQRKREEVGVVIV